MDDDHGTNGNSYVDKLHEVFLSCDTSGCELLGKDELIELCDKLQLDEDQAYYIIDHLLIDPFTKVDFIEFKEVFVSLLTRSQVDYDEITNLSNPCSPVKHKPSTTPTPTTTSTTTTNLTSSSSPTPTSSTTSTCSSTLSLSSQGSACSSTTSLLTVASSSSSLSSSSPSPSPCSSSSSPNTLTQSQSTNNNNHDQDKPMLDHHRHHNDINEYNNHNNNNLNDCDYDYDYDYHSLFNDNNNNNNNNDNNNNDNDNNNISYTNNNNDDDTTTATVTSNLSATSTTDPMSSATATTTAIINPTSAEQLLRSIWDKLRVGQDGYLNISELYAVCEHVGMEISDDVIEQLFEKLDCDRDGKVSFDELLQGLFEHNRSHVNNNCPTTTSNNNQVNDLFKMTPSGSPTCDHFDQKIDLTGGSTDSTMLTYNNSINSHNLHNQHIQHHYTNHHHHHSHHHHLDHPPYYNHNGHHQNHQRKVSLTSDHNNYLKCQPESNSRQPSEEDSFGTAGNYFQSLDPISIGILYEQTKAERDQLRINLSEANARADLLAQEVDDHHAKLEKSSKEKLILLERRYQEQIRCLQDEFQKERDSLGSQASQLRKELSTNQMVSQSNQSKLEDIISSLKLDNLRLEKEVQDLSDRLADAIKVNIDLQKEVEETYSIKKKLSEIELFQVFDKEAEYQALINDNEMLRRQNKELRDENDGLVLEMERMNQKLERRQKKGSKHDAASSMKRMRSYHKNWANEI